MCSQRSKVNHAQTRSSAILVVLAAPVAASSTSVSERPEPNVVELWSTPSHASVSLDCGAGKSSRERHRYASMFPRYPERCTIDLVAEGYRPLHMRYRSRPRAEEGLPLRDEIDCAALG